MKQIDSKGKQGYECRWNENFFNSTTTTTTRAS